MNYNCTRSSKCRTMIPKRSNHFTISHSSLATFNLASSSMLIFLTKSYTSSIVSRGFLMHLIGLHTLISLVIMLTNIIGGGLMIFSC